MVWRLEVVSQALRAQEGVVPPRAAARMISSHSTCASDEWKGVSGYVGAGAEVMARGSRENH